MPRFRQPPRTIPGATVTADRITFPLDDVNDPRYRAYQDSLSAYNRGKAEYEKDARAHYDNYIYDSKKLLNSELNTEEDLRHLHAFIDYLEKQKQAIPPYGEGAFPIISDKSIETESWHELTELKVNTDQGLATLYHYYEPENNGIGPFRRTIKPNLAIPYGEGGAIAVFKKPTYPMVTRELRPLNANPMTPLSPTSVSMREYPYEHTSQNWGRHWKSISGQSAPKGGGSYFINRKSDGTNDLLTPEEHENVLRTTQQRPTIRFRNGGVVPEQQQTFVDPGMAAMSKVVTMRNQNLNWVQRGLNPDLSPKINNPDGSSSTHELAWGSGENGSAFVYPTIIQGNNGGLQRLSGEDAWNHAVENRTAIRFKSPTLAEFYSKQGLIQHPLKFRNGGVVPRNNTEQLRPNVELNQRGPIATNPNFRQRPGDRTFYLPKETRERIFKSVEPNNYPMSEWRKASVRYIKNQSYDIERNEGTPVTVADSDAWAFFMGVEQKNNSVSRSVYVPTDAKDKNAKYFTLRNAYPDFDEKVLIDADDVFSDPDKIRLSPRGDFDNDMKVSDDNNTITGVRSRFYPLERVTYSRGEDERGKYYSIYDIYDFKVPFQKKIGQPYEVYDRTYYRDYGDGRNRVMYYNDNELLNLDLNKKNYSVLNLQRELYNRGYPLNSSLKEDGTFDGVLGPEVINALLDWRKKQQQTQ